MRKLIFFVVIALISLGSCDDANSNSQQMIIYSVTTKVDNSILDEWLSWADGHIEHVLETNKFSKAIFTKVNGLNDSDGPTYNVQFYAYSQESLDNYRKEDAPKIKAGTLKKFPKGLTNTRHEYQFIKEFKK